MFRNWNNDDNLWIAIIPPITKYPIPSHHRWRKGTKMKKVAAFVALVILLGACSGDVDGPARSATPSEPQSQVEIWVSRETNLNYPGEVWFYFYFTCEPSDFGFLPLSEDDPEFDRLHPELAEALHIIYEMDGVDLVVAGSQYVGVKPDETAVEDKVMQRSADVLRQHDFCNNISTI